MPDLDAGNHPVHSPPKLSEDQAQNHMPPMADDDLLTIEHHLEKSKPALQLAPTTKYCCSDNVAYYIQVIYIEATLPTLSTNLPCTHTMQTTDSGIAWILGRSRNCTIVFPDPAISRCHAVINWHREKRLQLMDVGSSNGTFINGKRLIAMTANDLTDGDVITISHIGIKIFIRPAVS